MKTIQSDTELIAIVPAGGVGQRASRDSENVIPKQYRLIRGQPMLRWTVQALLVQPRIKQILVGVQPDDAMAFSCLQGLGRVQVLPTAGPTRAETVMQTLVKSLEDGIAGLGDWVLVHDAARPGLPVDCLNRLINVCLSQNRSGLLAIPATDTVKLAAERTQGTVPEVQCTIARQRVWLAQTPQMARIDQLHASLGTAMKQGFEITDEASALECCGISSLLVHGSQANMKVTWPEDFDQIERYLP